MKTRRIGPFEVAEIGLGCMNLSHGYEAAPPFEDAERLLLQALERGVTLFDTAALYGFGANEVLVGKVLQRHRAKFVLASKGGMAGVNGVRVIDGRPEAIRRNVEDSLQRLQTDVIDLWYLHRWDKQVPIEDSVGEMARLVAEGKLRALGLSEVSAATLKKAHAVHPIAAVQSEYSLWTRNPEIAVLDACREIGAAFVAFSPVARQFLTGKLRDTAVIGPKDIRSSMPRFDAANYAANLKLLDGYEALCREAGCTPAQFAIRWLLDKAGHIVPIPGTRKLDHLLENLGAAGITLPPDVVTRAEALINQRTVAGGRYNAANQAEIDTEEFA